MNNVINGGFPNHFKKENKSMEYLDTIVNDLNHEVTCQEEHCGSSESPHYEYLESFRYREASRDTILREIESEVLYDSDDSDWVMEHLRKLEKQELFDFLEPLVTISYEGIRAIHNEILSVTLREIEYQHSDELEQKLDALTKEDFAYVKKEVEFYLHDSQFSYIDMHYQRFVMTLCSDTLTNALKEKGVV